MKNTTTNIFPQRNYGLDLLRLIAAFYVVVLHTVGLGGIIDATTPYSYQDFVGRLLIIFTCCAVNIFGIISGYVGYRETEKRISFSAYLTLWLTVVFYCLLYTGIFYFFLPGSVALHDFIRALFPVTNKLYWYFSSFTLVYCLSPFLNKILIYSSEKELKQLFFFICIVVVVLEFIGESFSIVNGYSAFWLLLLYLIGGILKKTKIGSNIPWYIAVAAIILINISLFFLDYNHTIRTFCIFSFDFDIDHSYITPFYVSTAILYVILFSRIKLCPLIKKILAFSTPAVFSIYIVNTNILLWKNFMWQDFMKTHLNSWANSSPLGLLVRIILFSFAFVVAVMIIDFFRQKLFHLFGAQIRARKRLTCFRNPRTN